jgi:integrase
MASSWVERRKTALGKSRYLIYYRLGGRGTRKHYAGSFSTMRAALARKQWVDGELAHLRVPHLAKLAEPTSSAFATVAAGWLASRIDVSPGTRIQNKTSVNRAVRVIGARRAEELRSHDIAEMVAQLHSEGVAPGYIRKVLQAVAMTLDYAGVDPNPARDRVVVRMPWNEPEEINPPTAEHVEGVYRLLSSRHRLALLWLDWSGARVSSVDRLLVGDYDVYERRVLLRARPSKTRKPLWVELHPLLAEAIEASLGPRDDRSLDARLFADSGADMLRSAIARACKAAGVPLFSPHDLRHRWISLMHLRGVPWVQIGQFVGQRNIAVTANTYSHVMLDKTELNYTDLLGHAHT